MSELDNSSKARPVSRAMRTLLYALTALTFIAGTQLFVLGDHTEEFFSWTIGTHMSAAFIGAGFWSASTVVFWCARQRDWVYGRVIVPTVAIVATLLLIATLQNLAAFHGPLGFAWIEVYAFFPPLLGAIAVQQLATPGRDEHSGIRLPRGLRAVLAGEAVTALVVGILLFVSSPGLASDLWPWGLTDLTSKAVGTWLIGAATTCGFVALVDDRAAMPGWALAQTVLGGGVLFGVLRFGGDIDFSAVSAYLVLAYFLATLASGCYGAWVAWREGLFSPTRGQGGLPVELRSSDERGGAPPRSSAPN